MEYLYYKVPISNSCLIPDDGLRYTMLEKSQVYCNQSQLLKLAEKVKGSLFSVKPDQLFASGIVYKTLQLCQKH